MRNAVFTKDPLCGKAGTLRCGATRCFSPTMPHGGVHPSANARTRSHPKRRCVFWRREPEKALRFRHRLYAAASPSDGTPRKWCTPVGARGSHISAQRGAASEGFLQLYGPSFSRPPVKRCVVLQVKKVKLAKPLGVQGITGISASLIPNALASSSRVTPLHPKP